MSDPANGEARVTAPSEPLSPDAIKAVLQKHGAWLRGEPDGAGADLTGANLTGADLSRANLTGAYLSGAKYDAATVWPAPTMVLLATWGAVSDDLTVELMRYDAANHPDPTAFDRWAAQGPCPYNDTVRVGRAAWFAEKRALWSPGPASRPYDLMQRLLAEKLRV